MQASSIAIAGLAFLLGLLPAWRAAADVASCSAAHASGQREVKAGNLRAALDMFNSCGADVSCPAAVRNECVDLFGSVQSIIPTVVFSAVDQDGNDLTEVRVFSGGVLIANGLDGRPVPVDPGKRAFLFKLPSGGVLMKEVLIRQGEKNRIVAVERRRQARGPVTASTSADAQPAPAKAGRLAAIPRSVWIATGIAAASLGSFTTFGLVGRQQERELARCSPNCNRAWRGEFDAMNRNYRIADASLVVAAVSAGVAAAIALTSRGQRAASSDRAQSSRNTSTVALAPAMFGRAGGLLMLQRQY